MKEAPKKVVLTLIGMASPKPGTMFWSMGEIRNAVIDFDGLELPCYSMEVDPPEDQRDDLIEAATYALPYLSEGTKEQEILRSALAKAGTL